MSWLITTRPPLWAERNERSHVIDYLRGKGWNVAGTARTDLFVSNGLEVPTPDNDDPLGEWAQGHVQHITRARAAFDKKNNPQPVAGVSSG